MSSFNRARRRPEDVNGAAETVGSNARPLSESADLDRLVEAASDASYVLVGEASHGTSEFYRWRARLTARLIEEANVAFVGVEGDWTDCYGVNRYVRHRGSDGDDARSVLDAYDRWPTWMWANWEVLEFVEWLRERNAARPPESRVGFYGLDVYGLYESMAAVIDYLSDRDPEMAARVRDAYQCFEPYGDDAREYARSTRLIPEDCREEVIDVLTDLRRGVSGRDDGTAESEFDAEQNALVVRNAEEYYRSMAEGGVAAWNVRDRHMTDTVDRLMERPAVDGTAVVWAHNTHVGDARATDMADRGEVNVGQLVRERHGADDVLLVGFGTHGGSVIAGESWGAPMERMTVPPSRETSYGDVFHRADVGDAYLTFDDVDDGSPLDAERGHRAIGVVYHPERELGNYVPTVLPERYDSFVHLEETSTLHPLHLEPYAASPPETYPWGV